MVQNYIRDGLLPPPVNKRIYTHKHLAALVMINHLKTVFEIAEIKAALLPYMDGEGMPLDIYNELLVSLYSITEHWKEHILPLFQNENILLMAHAADLKAAVQAKL